MHIGDEMELEKIKELALANGFSLKEQASGNMDLHSYVYEFANALLKEATPEGFVLVPRECPDPIFADKLFDHLCKKAHGEFGDDQMIFFSDIDESAIWQLMIEAQEQSHD